MLYFLFLYVKIYLSVSSVLKGIVLEVNHVLVLLKVVHLLVALGVIAGVLLQSGKSAGLSGAIDGGATHIFGKEEGVR